MPKRRFFEEDDASESRDDDANDSNDTYGDVDDDDDDDDDASDNDDADGSSMLSSVSDDSLTDSSSDDDDDDDSAALTSGTDSSADDDDDLSSISSSSDDDSESGVVEDMRVPFVAFFRVTFIDAFLRAHDGRGSAPYFDALVDNDARHRLQIVSKRAAASPDSDYVDYSAELPHSVVMYRHIASILTLANTSTFQHSDERVRRVAAAVQGVPFPRELENYTDDNKLTPTTRCALTGVRITSAASARVFPPSIIIHDDALDIFLSIVFLANLTSVVRWIALEQFDEACASAKARGRVSSRSGISPQMRITAALSCIENGESRLVYTLLRQFTHSLTLLGMGGCDDTTADAATL